MIDGSNSVFFIIIGEDYRSYTVALKQLNVKSLLGNHLNTRNLPNGLPKTSNKVSQDRGL